MFLNTVYISILSLLFCLLICKLYKPFKNSDLLGISEFLGGKFLKTIVGTLYISFFLLITSTLVRYFAELLKLIYFDNTSIMFILILLIVPPIIINRIGIRAISRTNLIFLPAVLISLLVLIFSLFHKYNFNNIFPILGYGAKETFLYGTLNISIFSSIGYLYFLPPLLKDLKDFKKVSIISIGISSLLLILTATSLLLLFPSMLDANELSR